MTVLYIMKRFEPALDMTVYNYQLGGETINISHGWNMIHGDNALNGEISYLYVSQQ